MAIFNLNEYLNSMIELDTLGLWHLVKVIVNHNQFENEPVVTKTMGIRSYDCIYCKEEQEKTNKTHMFCRRHLMLYEIRKFYVNEPAIFKLNNIIIFKTKYAIRKFNNVVISSFSDKHIAEDDLHKLLKFSFLSQDIPLIKAKEQYDISNILKVKELIKVTINDHEILFRNTDKDIVIESFK